MRPPVTIDLTAPEGNVFALVGKACATLEQAGQPVQATALREWFRTVPPLGGVSYDDVRRMVEQYCDVTWLHQSRPPDYPDTIRRMLAAMSSGLGADPSSGSGTPYLVTYDYTESGVPQRCALICAAPSVRGAAENFWNQHPGSEWFRLISVNDGNIEAYWVAKSETFVTIPEREREME
jgi:hypothetical protein